MAKHIKIHQGDSCYIPIKLVQNRVPLDAELLSELEIFVGSSIVRRLSDGGVFQQEGDTDYYIKLSQEDTMGMRLGQYDVAARATYRGDEKNSLLVHIGRITILPAHPFESKITTYSEELRGEFPGEIKIGVQGPPGPKGDPGDSLVLTPEDKQEIATMVLSSGEIAQMQKDVADLKYTPISITSISNNVGTVEKGYPVSQMKVSWQVNKTPVSQTVDGVAVDVSERSKVVDMTGKTSVKVVVTDERGTKAEKSTGYNAYNAVYYGTMDDGAEIDRNAILALSKKVQNSIGITFTTNPSANQRIAYALPVSYGTPAFRDPSNFPIDMSLATAEPFLFENAHGHEENYNVWLSTEIISESTTVTVS